MRKIRKFNFNCLTVSQVNDHQGIFVLQYFPVHIIDLHLRYKLQNLGKSEPVGFLTLRDGTRTENSTRVLMYTCHFTKSKWSGENFSF